MVSRAGLNRVAGRIWPAGRSLEIPDLQEHKIDNSLSAQSEMFCVTVKNIFLFGMWAKILFRIYLHPKCLHGFVHGCNKDGVHESHVRLTPLEDF